MGAELSCSQYVCPGQPHGVSVEELGSAPPLAPLGVARRLPTLLGSADFTPRVAGGGKEKPSSPPPSSLPPSSPPASVSEHHGRRRAATRTAPPEAAAAGAAPAKAPPPPPCETGGAPAAAEAQELPPATPRSGSDRDGVEEWLPVLGVEESCEEGVQAQARVPPHRVAEEPMAGRMSTASAASVESAASASASAALGTSGPVGQEPIAARMSTASAASAESAASGSASAALRTSGPVGQEPPVERCRGNRKSHRKAERSEAKALVRPFLDRAGFRSVNSKRNWLWASYPLHVAVRENDPELVRLLIKAGADPKLADALGRTPHQLAESKDKEGSHAAVLAALGTKRRGFSASASSSFGSTASSVQ